MDSKFNNKTTEGEAQAQPQEKGRQTGMVVLLLLLLGGFGYLYFFTGLIRPQEQPPAPQPPPQVVKQPLPARDAAPADAAKPAEQRAQATPSAPVPAAPAVAKPADTKVAATPAPRAEEKKAAAKPAAKPEPVKAAAPAVKKPEAVKPAVPVKQAEKNVAETKPAQSKQAEPARKAAIAPKKSGPWTVVAGLYVVEETLAADMNKVKNTGLTPLMTSGPKRPVTMHRLFYAEYSSKDEAKQAVEKLQRTSGGGFSVQRGDKHEVYAGSYAVLSGAQAEQQRLAAAGVKVTIKKSQVSLASRKLTAGTFTDRKVAEDALKKLKSAGISAAVLE